MPDPRARWLDKAQSLLPPEDQVLARNARITAVYAELYLRRRTLFKWAGMAAFASYQVGTALRPLEVDEYIGSERDDLELVRETNNAVYADIAWAHFAYEEAGIEEVRRCLGGSPDHRALLEGFEHIDIAARSSPPTEERVWRGNLALLRHEQERTVQPRFDRFDTLFGIALTWASMLDFDADDKHLDPGTLSEFKRFMFTRGWLRLLRSFSLPNVVNLDQRWYWISESLLPRWQQVDRSDPLLEQKMKRLMRGPDRS